MPSYHRHTDRGAHCLVLSSIFGLEPAQSLRLIVSELLDTPVHFRPRCTVHVLNPLTIAAEQPCDNASRVKKPSSEGKSLFVIRAKDVFQQFNLPYSG